MRHWDEIARHTGKEIKLGKLTFSRVLELGLMNHLELCQQVGEKAYREFQIQQDIQSLQKEWV